MSPKNNPNPKPPKKPYIQDGALPKEDESKTVPPYAFRVFKDGKEKKGKDVEKVFVGEDAIEDLSGRIISALGNPIRLKILLYLDSQAKKPQESRDITDEMGIFRHLKYSHNIVNAGLRQNHLKPLVDAGLIRKIDGYRGGNKVKIYETIPGALESLILILTNLNQEVRKSLDGQSQLKSDHPILTILGGPQDREKYEIHQNPTLLGRIGTLEDKSEYKDDILFSNHYQSITRVVNPQDPAQAPHARLICEEEHWYLEDCGNNQCGTFINEKKIHEKTKLKDYDVIGLARGKYGADLLFRKPSKELIVKENYLTDLGKKLSPSEQEALTSKIQIIISKIDTQFFMETLDEIINRIEYLQEIETIIPTLKEDEKINIETHSAEEKELAEKIREKIDKKEDMDFQDPIMKRYYSDLKGKWGKNDRKD